MRTIRPARSADLPHSRPAARCRCRSAPRACACARPPPSRRRRSARQIGIGGAAQALARRQQRHGLEQVGLAGAVGADQHLRLGTGLERQLRVVAEIRQRKPLDPKHVRCSALWKRWAGRSAPRLHAHRHQHVERRLVARVVDHGRRARIGELERRPLALELAGDIEQIASVEADLKGLRACTRRRSPRWRCRLPGC